MRLALIKNGVVVNVVVAAQIPADKFGADIVVASDVAGVGDVYDGELFTTPYVEPAEPVAPIVTKVLEVTCFQAKVALDNAGLLSSVQALMDDAATPNRIKLAWNNGATFKRYGDMILSMASILNLSDEQLDDLFAFAATVS